MLPIALTILNYDDLGAIGSVALILILMSLAELYINKTSAEVRSST